MWKASVSVSKVTRLRGLGAVVGGKASRTSRLKVAGPPARDQGLGLSCWYIHRAVWGQAGPPRQELLPDRAARMAGDADSP
jgi:hypothetical protein